MTTYDFCIFFFHRGLGPKKGYLVRRKKNLKMFIAAFVEAKISETSQILHFFSYLKSSVANLVWSFLYFVTIGIIYKYKCLLTYFSNISFRLLPNRPQRPKTKGSTSNCYLQETNLKESRHCFCSWEIPKFPPALDKSR